MSEVAPGPVAIAEHSAHTTEARLESGRPGRIRRRMARLEEGILGLYARIEGSSLRTAVAGEWLLDNHHLVTGSCTQLRAHLRRPFLASLPKADAIGTPRVEVLSRELIEASGGYADRESIDRFVTAYQRVSALRLGELWALPAFLRLHALESLVAAAEELLSGSQAEEPGEAVAIRPLLTRLPSASRRSK